MRKIPASYPQITDEDKQILQDVINRGWFTESKYCRLFAQELCKVTGMKHTLLVNSGSSANFIALKTLLDYFPGKLILTCACAFPTTVAPIYQHGKIPLYVDIDPKTLSPNIGQIAYVLDQYGKDIAGAILTHTMGFPYNEPLVKEMLGGDRFLISDCCDAIGATIGELPVGTWSDMATYSFFPAHHICAIEGGAITSNNLEYVETARQYINWGRKCRCLPGQTNTCGTRFERKSKSLPDGWDCKYTFTKLGYNLKMTEFQGALGYSQIQRLEQICIDRRSNYGKLYGNLHNLSPYLDFVRYDPKECTASPFGFPVILKDEYKTLINPLIQYLEENGIATRRMFGGNIIRQPAFENLQYVTVPDLDGSNIMLEQSFWVGCYPGITDDDIDYMVDTFYNFFGERGLY